MTFRIVTKIYPTDQILTTSLAGVSGSWPPHDTLMCTAVIKKSDAIFTHVLPGLVYAIGVAGHLPRPTSQLQVGAMIPVLCHPL